MAIARPQKRDIAVHPVPKSKKELSLLQQLSRPTVILVGLFIMIVGTCFLYLSEFNSISSQGVVINQLERERSKLIIENEVWNMRIARLKSLDTIEQQEVVQKMQLIQPEDVEFVNLDERNDS